MALNNTTSAHKGLWRSPLTFLSCLSSADTQAATASNHTPAGVVKSTVRAICSFQRVCFPCLASSIKIDWLQNQDDFVGIASSLVQDKKRCLLAMKPG